MQQGSNPESNSSHCKRLARAASPA
uniref:Uncharacterized protein n=1 Tax=Arundo donax TaxID=35708 RepID=A0A0A9A554_ARUDO